MHEPNATGGPRGHTGNARERGFDPADAVDPVPKTQDLATIVAAITGAGRAATGSASES